jgi:hypothetical protein
MFGMRFESGGRGITMKVLLFAALFFTATHVHICAQGTVEYEWSLQAVQADFAVFPLGFIGTLSWSGAVDIDFGIRKHADGSEALYGCQIGFSQFDWPYFENLYKHEHYSGSDVDLLLRYTSRSFPFRTDIIAGLSIRDGDYKNTHTDAQRGSRERSVTAGLKLGGAMTIMVIRPAIAVRVKASCRVFGFKALEGGALGLGLVLGWQRED